MELDTYVKQIKSRVKEISDKSENANDFFLLHGEDICEIVCKY